MNDGIGSQSRLNYVDPVAATLALAVQELVQVSYRLTAASSTG
jgi:hypothetical protein